MEPCLRLENCHTWKIIRILLTFVIERTDLCLMGRATYIKREKQREKNVKF